MKTYACPKCGSQMIAMMTASIPPIYSYWCNMCGYKSKSVKEMCDMEVLPEWLQQPQDGEEGKKDG